jgi:hypothetical protein
MDSIKIEITKDTPSVTFNLDENLFDISGKSMPENPTEFYKPIYDWIIQFSAEYKNTGIELNVSLEYLNSSSIKLVFIIFNALNEYYKNTEAKSSTCINWIYKSNDELIKMKGEEFKDYLEIPFNLILKD